MSHAPVRRRTLAAALSLVIALGGSLVALQPATAEATPSVTISPSADVDTTVSNTFTVSGTGFTGAGAANGTYVLLGPADNWTPGTPLPSSGWIAQAWVPSIVDGAFSTTIVAPAASMDPTGSYVIVTSAAHALSATDRSLDTFTPIGLKAVEPEPEPEPEPDPEPEPEPDPVAGITVTPTTGLDSGDTVTITGSYPATVDVAGTPRSTSLYAMYCIDPGDARATGAQCDSSRQLALSPVALYGGMIPATGTVTDGWWTFEVTMAVTDAFGTHECAADGSEQCGIFTRLDHNFAGNYTYDSFTPVTFAATPAAPTITVSKTTELTPAGEVVTVTGTGFSPQPPATTATRPPLAGQFGGVYVVFGKFADVWRPSEGATSSTRKVSTQKWVVNPESATLDGMVPINADGSFEVQLLVKPGFTGEPATGNYGIYTYPGGGASFATFETYTPISFSTAPTVVVSKTTDISPAGETVTISGWNFGAQPPATTGTRPPLAGQFGGAYVVFGKFADVWKPSASAPSSTRKVGSQAWVVNPENATLDGMVPINADGSFTVTLPVKPGFTGEPATGNYGIYTYSGSGASFAGFETYTPITFSPAASTSVALAASPSTGLGEGDTTTLTATVSPAVAGTVTFTDGATELGTATVVDGTASLETPELTVGAHSFGATFTPAAPLEYAGSTASLSLEVAGPVITNPLTWGVKESFRNYVTGPIAHGAITTRGVGASDGLFQFGSTTGGTYTGDTGTGTAKYTGSVRFTGHSGALDLTLSDPIVEVTSATDGVLYLKVNGGTHVPFATLDLSGGTRTTTDSTIQWAGVPASLTSDGAAAFSLGGSAFYPVGEALDPVTFVVAAVEPTPVVPTSVALSATPASGALVGATVTLAAKVTPAAAGTVTFYSGSTVLGTRSVSATSSTATLAFTTTAAGVTTLRAEFAPTDATAFLPSRASLDYTVTAPVVSAGSLSWGVKASFRSYVTGGIAKGAITTSGVGVSGGEFVFGQSTGGSFTTATGTGTSNYSGSVRFTGHDGLLDLTLSNPIVQVDSASSGTLYVSVNGSSPVAFATLDLAAGSYSTPGGAVAWTSVPASLTSAGASAFSLDGANFYAPGTALDPVSFVIGSPSAGGGGGGSQTVDAYEGEREPADTPPATEGITILNPDDIVAGGEITASASGFEANEEGILVVIYSTPVVLSRTLTADADGVATWTGRLPGTLTGTHTLTFQGSVNRGVVLDIPARVATAAAGCTVEGATISWGFKESFRSYISGTIANGEWTVDGGATYETPLFGWSDGSGSYDAETAEGLVAFPGSITFTGHGGILNTTVSNPQLQFIDETTAILLLDVSGTTQEGEPVDLKGVEFVELSLDGAVTLADDVLTLKDAPAVLLAEGAAAFGTYETGEPFDALSAELPLDPGCAEVVAPEETPIADEPTGTDAPTLWWAWLIAGLALLAVIAAIIVVILRRRTE